MQVDGTHFAKQVHSSKALRCQPGESSFEGWDSLASPVESHNGWASRCPYHVQGYADYIVLAVEGKFAENLTCIMNKGLRQVVNWCKRENLRVSTPKMVIVPLTLKRKGLGAYCILKINESVLPFPARLNIWR